MDHKDLVRVTEKLAQIVENAAGDGSNDAEEDYGVVGDLCTSSCQAECKACGEKKTHITGCRRDSY